MAFNCFNFYPSRRDHRFVRPRRGRRCCGNALCYRPVMPSASVIALGNWSSREGNHA